MILELSCLNYKYGIRHEAEDKHEKLGKTMKNTLKTFARKMVENNCSENVMKKTENLENVFRSVPTVKIGGRQR